MHFKCKDARRQIPGQYLLTGSQNLLLMQQVSETLAGRAAVLRLLPLAHRETDGRRLGRLPWELTRARTGSLPTQETIWRSILRGGYPEIALDNARNAELWHRSYVQTYLERDVRTDTGTLCFLTGLRDPRHAAEGPLGGALFETAVLAEITRTLWHRGEEPRVHFWRTSAGVEVDFLVEDGTGLIPIEVKLSATPRVRMAAGIEQLRADLGERTRPGYVVHPGTVELPLGRHAMALPFGRLWR